MASMDIKLKEVIRREMKSRKVSLNELSRATSISLSTLHGWKHGVKPSAKNLHLIKYLAKYFELTVNELLFNEKEAKGSNQILFSSTFSDQDRVYKIVVEKIKT